ARGVERNERLARLAVAHEFDAPEEALATHLADRWMPLREPGELRAEHLAHRSRVLDDALLLKGLDRRDRRRAREHVPGVGQATCEEAVLHPVSELLVDDHRAERHVA